MRGGNNTLPRRLLLSGAVAGAAVGALSPATAFGDDLEDEGYELDKVSRKVPKRGRLKCPAVDTKKYRGTHLKYAQYAKVYVGFADRLALMEKVINKVATEIYGRAPAKLVHIGAYNCRRIRKYPEWLSEHALANALDVEGFNFGKLGKGDALPDGLPKVLRHAFAVRVQRHWKAKHGVAKVHRKFLRALTPRLIARKEIFRVLLGPAYPGHHNHFHFDCAPFRMVEGFEEDE